MSTIINDNTRYIEFTVSSHDEFVSVLNKLIKKYPPIGWRQERFFRTNATIVGKTTIIYYRINNDSIYMFYKPNNLARFRQDNERSSAYAVYNQHKILKYNKDVK